ncbi:MAG: toll/interleukin-1 receptor domain-containing protein, partial [Pseudanabaenales cyanobacterium]|nr:toll/interleukin-1 receptor domain-containing protein [Pseudanabaenales cyanobacterium]
ALSLNKRIIPLLAKTIDPAQVPSALRDLQYINLTDNLTEEDYQLDESQLLKILWRDAAYYKRHKILLVKALRWKRQYRNPSILLRDHNLRDAESWLKIAKQRTQHHPTSLQEIFIDESLRRPPATSLDVFITYSEVDSGFARRLNDALQNQGKTTWFAQEEIAAGTNFQQESYRGIERSNNLLFILSPSSVNALTCINELVYAAKLNKRVIAILHRPIDPQDLHPKLTPFLCELGSSGFSDQQSSHLELGASSHLMGVSKVQWIDFNQAETDFLTQFNQLVRTLDTDREYVHSHTKWSQRALEWKQKGRDQDLLLRGSELVIAESWLQDAEVHNKKPSVTDLQKAFIREGRALCDRLQQQKQERQKIELRARIASWAILAVIVTTSLAGFSFYQWRRAARNYEEALRALDKAQTALDIAQNYEQTMQTLNQPQGAVQLPQQAAVPAPTASPITETPDQEDPPPYQALPQAESDVIPPITATPDQEDNSFNSLRAFTQRELDSIQSELDSIRSRLSGERKTR